MKNKIIYISPELQKAKQNIKERLNIGQYTCLDKDPYRQIMETKKQNTIHIYDLSKQAQTKQIKKIYKVNNHINKTGINPLRAQQTGNIHFYDITEIYIKHKEGIIADCFGNKPASKTRQGHISTNFLCNYVVCAHIFGFTSIYGYIVE